MSNPRPPKPWAVEAARAKLIEQFNRVVADQGIAWLTPHWRINASTTADGEVDLQIVLMSYRQASDKDPQVR